MSTPTKAFYLIVLAIEIITTLSLNPAYATKPEQHTQRLIQNTTPTSYKHSVDQPDAEGWQKLAGNHIETVYIKDPPHNIDPNILGIEVKVVAETKELFDYAKGIAMADCSIQTVFPASGNIYNINGEIIDPMHIPLMQGIEYVKGFPKEAYDGLLERLCSKYSLSETTPTSD